MSGKERTIEKKYIKTCENPGCKKEYKTDDKYQSWCSDFCKSKFHKCECRKCYREFYSYVRSRAFCSTECKMTNCIMCGKRFLPKSSQKTCSDACDKKRYTFICKGCGGSFYKKAVSAAFCSTECRMAVTISKKKYSICKNCKKVITLFKMIL